MYEKSSMLAASSLTAGLDDGTGSLNTGKVVQRFRDPIPGQQQHDLMLQQHADELQGTMCLAPLFHAFLSLVCVLRLRRTWLSLLQAALPAQERVE